MSVESTKKAITKYFESEHDDVSMMTDDVVFTVMATGQEHHTPEGVLGMLNYFYHVAFDAKAEASSIIYGDNQAVWEGLFIGKHVGEFAGIPATGKSVSVPLCVVYDVVGEKIKAGRVYFEMPALFAQLGIEMG